MSRSKDPVTPGVHRQVLDRDKMCFLYRVDPVGHECRDAFGWPHGPYERGKLTVDHVKKGLMMGRRAPSTPAFLVAMCHQGNTNVPSKTVRMLEREYLANRYPEDWKQ